MKQPKHIKDIVGKRFTIQDVPIDDGATIMDMFYNEWGSLPELRGKSVTVIDKSTSSYSHNFFADYYMVEIAVDNPDSPFPDVWDVPYDVLMLELAGLDMMEEVW